MAKQWRTDGDARGALLKDPEAGVAAIATGIGSLSYGELAGERMKLGLCCTTPRRSTTASPTTRITRTTTTW